MEEQRKERTIDELAAENDALRKKADELNKEIEYLQQQVNFLKKSVFGSKSEKKVLHDTENAEQLSLFNEAETEARREEAEEVSVPAHKRKKKRSRAEILGDLPVEEVVHEVEDKTCDRCGSEMKQVGKEFVHDELVYVPAKLFIRKHYVEVVKCVSCGKNESRDAELDDIEREHFRKATAPAMLIPRSFCSPELLAHIIYSKYNNAMPLYRIEQDMKDHGVMLSRTTMANWIIKIAEEKAKPVYELMKAELLSGRIIHADETVVQVLHEQGRSAKTQSRMWVYCTPACSGKYLVLYDYCQTRGGYNAVSFLGNYSGYVVCDGYDGYNRLTQAKRCGCFAHVRRKLVEALPSDKELWATSAAAEGVRRCDRLFALEREFDGKDKDGKQVREPLSPEEKHRRRNEEVRPLLDDFFNWLMTVNPAGGSKLAKAVQYALNEKRYLYGFLADPGIEISNNRAENAVRPFVVGRKNWLFSDSPKGASASAMLYSLVVSAKMNGLNAEEYLVRLFRSDVPMLPY